LYCDNFIEYHKAKYVDVETKNRLSFQSRKVSSEGQIELHNKICMIVG